uniref:Uncharacterized protein ORF114 n=1 Tax=Nothoceros aenigmaticus TaxID=13813 RepID=C3RYQ1_9EMBR|nr:hypothetical protein MeaeMp50 [Nothoceros aenigmaticus]ACC86807.1 hypothetical protein MeaeMp50 [Nothoceros aenigmaticus]
MPQRGKNDCLPPPKRKQMKDRRPYIRLVEEKRAAQRLKAALIDLLASSEGSKTISSLVEGFPRRRKQVFFPFFYESREEGKGETRVPAGKLRLSGGKLFTRFLRFANGRGREKR